MPTIVRVKRGTDAQRLGYTPLLGELVYAQDTKNVYIGDGIQIGGIPLNGNSILKTQMAVANGVATLDAGGKIPENQLPNLSISDVTVVADIAARDALTNQQAGDTAVVTDAGGGEPKTFMMNNSASWIEIKSPTAAVSTVAGRTGAVVLTSADLGDFNVTGATAGQVLIWDAVGSKWKNATLPAGVTKFVNLSDVGVPAANGGKVMALNAAGDGVTYIDVIDGGTF